MTDKASVDALIGKLERAVMLIETAWMDIEPIPVEVAARDEIKDCIVIIRHHFAEQPTNPAQRDVERVKQAIQLTAEHSEGFCSIENIEEVAKAALAAMQPAPVVKPLYVANCDKCGGVHLADKDCKPAPAVDEDVLIAIVKEELFDAKNIEGYDIDRGACNLLKNIKSYLAQSTKPVSLWQPIENIKNEPINDVYKIWLEPQGKISQPDSSWSTRLAWWDGGNFREQFAADNYPAQVRERITHYQVLTTPPAANEGE